MAEVTSGGAPVATNLCSDLSGNLLAESRSDGRPIRDYVWTDGAPLAQIRTRISKRGTLKKNGVVYLHTDHLNTPRLGTGKHGTVVWRWEGDAFGRKRPDTDPDGDGNNVNVRLRFPGQYFDAETGLH